MGTEGFDCQFVEFVLEELGLAVVAVEVVLNADLGEAAVPGTSA